MREAVFVRNNKETWQQFEKLTSRRNIDPDQLSDLYLKITDDLSFAKTHYPNSRTHQYLNSIASKVYLSIYRNKKEKSSRFITFWKNELPLVYYQNRKNLLISLLIFAASMAIGALSVLNDETFARIILGDGYVNMTIDNIENGDPLAVYKGHGETTSFLFITVNNIRVSFLAFAAGIFLSVGTGYILFNNGVMVGVFQLFFLKYGLLQESFLTIWIHGTLEISAIVIAGGAGITMGNSILFPGTYPRGHSLLQGAKNGVKMVIGLVPVFITAGFLEGFVTRHYQTHWAINLTIIVLSAIFIIYYFIIYPRKVYHDRVSQN